jgi:hemoglobin-like flavoprotein
MALSASAQTFLDSLNRCLKEPRFLEEFYAVFMASSPEVREKFRDTDPVKQARVLADSLYALAVVAQGTEGSPAWGDFPRLAERHSRRDLDIRPEMYDLWLDCLLGAARRCDRLFSPQIEQAWRETLAIGIEYLRSRH